MPRTTITLSSPGQLYALRLSPTDAHPGLQGEIEHVVSGARSRFQHSGELVAWLERCHELQREAGEACDAAHQTVPGALPPASSAPTDRDAST